MALPVFAIGGLAGLLPSLEVFRRALTTCLMSGITRLLSGLHLLRRILTAHLICSSTCLLSGLKLLGKGLPVPLHLRSIGLPPSIIGWATLKETSAPTRTTCVETVTASASQQLCFDFPGHTDVHYRDPQ